jgi:hypothetical protein
VTRTGGCGGFLASVRANGATGQQQHAITVSADDDVRGGAGGRRGLRGGGTKPGSSVPSLASTVPTHSVAASIAVTVFFVFVCMASLPICLLIYSDTVELYRTIPH